MLKEYLNNELLIICPNSTKNTILNDLKNKNTLYQIKFMSIEEFIENYFYKYDERANVFLMEKYNVIMNVSKVYLENMYAISTEKEYKSKKLNDLKEKKEQLIKNNLLIFNKGFKDYLKTKKILIINYNKLEKYIKEELTKFDAIFIDKEKQDKKLKVYTSLTIETELNSMFQKIICLLKNNVNPNNIHILNVQEEYIYLLEKLAGLYNIPLSPSSKSSIYTSRTTKRFLEEKKIPGATQYNKEIINKIVDVVNSLVKIKDSKYYEEILIDRLKHTYVKDKVKKETINIEKLYERDYTDDDYVFILSFNEGILPTLYKDEDFIPDKYKDEVSLYTTKEKNKREKTELLKFLTNIKNLYISYKINGFSSEYYKSSIITDENMEEEKIYEEDLTLSDSYNKRKLSIYLDKFIKFKEEDKNLKALLKTYPNNLYNSYDNSFTKIDPNTYLRNINNQIKLSYTSMSEYNKCAFKYYVKYVLKLDPMTNTFQTFLGNLYHYLLSLCITQDFDFEKEWDNYLKKENLTIKDKFLLRKLKTELKKVIEIIKEQRMYTDFKDNYYEKKLTVKIDNDKINALFTGTIDKIMFFKELEETYYAIIDYKTGSYEPTLNNMKYGLGMQLATYLYLIEKSRLFSKSTLAGFYFQKVLIGNVSYNNKKNYEEIISSKLKLDGYSTSDEEVLSKFDHEYTDSKVIKSLKMTSNGFSRYAKLLNDEDIKNIINYTDKIIKETIENILNRKFDINPKIIGEEEVACKFCSYKDLCYKKEEDYIRLEKQTDLSYINEEITNQN